MKTIFRLISAVVLWGSMSASAQEAGPTAVAPAPVEQSEREPVLMIGDSMMRMLSIALEKEFRKRGIEASSFASLGSGLVRLDAFDWFAKINALLDERQPGTAIVILGTNDDQPLLSDAGTTVAKGSDEWDREYASRLAQVMDIFTAKGAKRVIWILLPDMKQDAQQRYAQRINGLIAAAAATRPMVTLYDSRTVLSRRPGAPYASTLIGKDGQVIQVRGADGIHLSRDGADRLAAAVADAYWKE